MNAPEWPKARVEELMRLHAEQLSASVIGERLGGLSRNAVLGKLHRLGLRTDRPNPHSPNGRTAANPKKRVPSALRRKSISKPIPKPRAGENMLNESAMYESAAPVSVISNDDIPKSQRVTSILNLKSHHCKWPCGDLREGTLFFCGGERLLGSPYCGAHKAIATVGRQG